MTACGIVLAAGAARRFGSAKQLADLGGRPLLQWSVDAACASALDRVVVVVGAQAAEVRRGLDPGRAELITCPDWDEGMAASLRCGVRAAAGARWALVLLGDAPLLEPAVIDRILAGAGDAAPAAQAVRARWADGPGHPVAFRDDVFDRLLALQGDAGARDLLRELEVAEVVFGDRAAPADVDDEAQLARARQALTRGAPRG